MVTKGTRARRTGTRGSGGRTAVQTDEQEIEQEEERATLFDLGDDDKIVYVWRIHPVSKKMVYQYKLQPDEATEEEIQRLSGGGVYTCREKGRNEDGIMVFGRQRTVEIAGVAREPLVPKATADELAPTGAAVAGPVVGESQKTSMDDIMMGGVLRLFTTQAEASEVQARMFQAMADRPQTDWAAVLTAAMPLLVALLAKKDDAPNPMEIVTQVASLVKESASSANSFKEQLEVMNEVFDIKERTAPAPEDGLSMLAAQLPKILEIISSEQTTKGRMPTQEEVQQRLATAAPSPAADPSTPKKVAMPIHLALLKKFKPLLVQWSQQGKDAGLMGEFLANSVPERFRGAVQEFLLREDAEALVYQVVPELQQYPAWTRECFDALADAFGLGAEGDEEVPPTPEADVIFEVDADGQGTAVEEQETTVVEKTVEEE